MGAVKDSRDALNTLLSTVEGVNVYAQAVPNISPPAAFVSLPLLVWETACGTPTTVQFTVYLMVKNDEYAIDNLTDLVLEVQSAIDEDRDFSVQRADWNTVQVGSVELPCYEILVEASL